MFNHPLFPVIALGVLAAVVYVGYRYYLYTRPKTHCLRCGGEMHPDPYKYRYTIEWTCSKCGDTVEQLRNQ